MDNNRPAVLMLERCGPSSVSLEFVTCQSAPIRQSEAQEQSSSMEPLGRIGDAPFGRA
jgi:hypothetical protein